MSLQKEKKNQVNSGQPPKPWLISKIYNPWNSRPGLNQKVRLSINLMLKDEIEKKNLRNFLKLKKKNSKEWESICNQWNRRPRPIKKAQFPTNLTLNDEIRKKINYKFFSK
jgi:hypothetical protein